MTLPPSPMLARLEAALAAAVHPVDRACARAELAGFQARQGVFDEARQALTSLRSEFAQRPVTLVTVWVCVVEAWVEHYSGRVTAGRDKMLRAHALAAAAGLRPMQALSAAWLAHVCFSQDDMEDMARHLVQALQLAEPDHHTARARASLVAASAYHWANRLDLAQPWYARAREHAMAEADDATMGVITFTMAGHRSNHVFHASILGDPNTEEARRTQAWIDASVNFDRWVGTVSQTAFMEMFRAQVFSAQHEHAKAQAQYAAYLDEACAQGLEHMRAAYVADQAWCRFHVGDVEGARRGAAAAAALIIPGMYVEDAAVACGRLAQVYEALADDVAAGHYRSLANDHWAQEHAMQRSVIELLDRALKSTTA